MATATQKTTQDKVKASLDRLEKGIEELLQSGKWQDYLRMQSRFHTYSYRNVVLILLQSPEAVQVAGFNAWKGLNRFVKKGEKGIGILAPLIRKSEENE
ncbi:MAG: ssDNA-binding domain-containing protein, partial [Phormidesmis sp. CAN_BIN44]|nr:ssDNA-binding domain-containing protein [Phormidesmis sp. CAN_BIN44]